MNASAYLSLSHLFPELNRAREKAGLRPYSDPISARQRLNAKKCPTIKPDAGHTLFHRESACRIACLQPPTNTSPPPEFPKGRYTAARHLLKEVNALRSVAGFPIFRFRAGLIIALVNAECPHIRYGQDIIFHAPTARRLAPSLKRPACDITQAEHLAAARLAAEHRAQILACLAQ